VVVLNVSTSRASAGAGVTASGTLPEIPPAVPVSVTFPAATPVTVPAASTVATAVFEEVQVTGPVAIGCPC
jgi:hypothetical protein